MPLIIAFAWLCANITHAQELTVDVDAVKSLVTKWNEAHTVNTVDNLSSLYSNTVNFYGSSLLRDRCISIKRELLEEQKDFNQELNGDLFLSGYSSGVIRCDFVKTVIRNGKAADYDAYLVIERISGKYLIVAESDLLTDQNNDFTPDLGKKVTIKQRKADPGRKTDPVREDSNPGYSLTGIFQLVIAVVIGAAALIFALRTYKKPKVVKKIEGIVESVRRDKETETNKPIGKDPHVEKGLAFEKYIVEQFAIDRNYFTLQEWRSDKFHEGIAPASNRNPDLEYLYKSGTFIRKFSIECKYRSKAPNATIHLMDETQYRIYEAFHKSKMPVYVVVGFRGEPNNPAELFLIPFEFVKTEMPFGEITKFKKTGKFFYDMHTDRLT